MSDVCKFEPYWAKGIMSGGDFVSYAMGNPLALSVLLRHCNLRLFLKHLVPRNYIFDYSYWLSILRIEAFN